MRTVKLQKPLSNELRDTHITSTTTIYGIERRKFILAKKVQGITQKHWHS
jgi:hypothetical protein